MPCFFEEISKDEIGRLMLFEGLSPEEIDKVVECLKASECCFPKDHPILNRREDTSSLGILLKGSAFVVSSDSEGNRSILATIQQNEIFGIGLLMDDFYENLAVIAAEDCTILMIDADKLFWGCPISCHTHKQMLYNVINILSRTNLGLMRKSRHISQHSLRRKILSFLDEQSQYQKSADFQVPFNRQEMADYLGADRSALSAELSRMKKEGIIDFEKNHFILKKPGI